MQKPPRRVHGRRALVRVNRPLPECSRLSFKHHLYTAASLATPTTVASKHRSRDGHAQSLAVDCPDMASDAAFLRASTSKLNRPFEPAVIDLPAPRSRDDADNPTDSQSIPSAVLESALANLSTSMAAARKARLAPSVAAAVVEQVIACRDERVAAKKRRDAVKKRKGKLSIPAQDSTAELGATWWGDLPEEWAEGGDAADGEVETEAAEQYVVWLARKSTRSC